MSEAEPQFNESADPVSPGLLLTGEGLSSMTPERLQMLGEMVGGLGLKVTVVGDLEAPGLQQGEPEPVPATQITFRKFATEKHYTHQLANRSFNTAMFTGIQHRQGKTPYDPLPPVRFLSDVHDDHVLDLRSIHQRLVASDMHPSAWFKCGKGMIRFLAHIVNEQVQPDNPLPIK